LDKLTEDGYRGAINFFQQAIDKDPTYGAAYAEMGRCYSLLGYFGYLPGAEAYPKAIAAAKRALDLDHDLAEADAALGHAYLMTWNWAAAESELRRAIEMNPSLSEAHLEYGLYLMNIGNLADAATQIRLAYELDPLSTSPTAVLGFLYLLQRDYDKAITQYNKSLETSPNSAIVHYNLSGVYEDKLMYNEAVAELEQALRLEGKTEEANAVDASYKRTGYKGLLRMRIPTYSDPASKEYSPESVAEMYLVLGDKDQTFIWLNKAYEARSSGLLYLKVYPPWDSIRSDPRYADLLRRMGLPQ